MLPSELHDWSSQRGDHRLSATPRSLGTTEFARLNLRLMSSPGADPASRLSRAQRIHGFSYDFLRDFSCQGGAREDGRVAAGVEVPIQDVDAVDVIGVDLLVQQHLACRVTDHDVSIQLHVAAGMREDCRRRIPQHAKPAVVHAPGGALADRATHGDGRGGAAGHVGGGLVDDGRDVGALELVDQVEGQRLRRLHAHAARRVGAVHDVGVGVRPDAVRPAHARREGRCDRNEAEGHAARCGGRIAQIAGDFGLQVQQHNGDDGLCEGLDGQIGAHFALAARDANGGSEQGGEGDGAECGGHGISASAAGSDRDGIRHRHRLCRRPCRESIRGRHHHTHAVSASGKRGAQEDILDHAGSTDRVEAQRPRGLQGRGGRRAPDRVQVERKGGPWRFRDGDTGSECRRDIHCFGRRKQHLVADGRTGCIGGQITRGRAGAVGREAVC